MPCSVWLQWRAPLSIFDGCDTAIRDHFLSTASSGSLKLGCLATSTPLPFRLPTATVGGR